MKELITLEQYKMGRDRQYPAEYTKEIEQNAIILLQKVNAFLFSIGIEKVTVNSGWRPAAVNAALPTAAKKSNHMIGFAVDVADADCSLWKKVIENLDKCQQFGLYMEDKRWTPTWVHFQCVGPKSGNRIFIPSTASAIAPNLWDGKYDSKFNK